MNSKIRTATVTDSDGQVWKFEGVGHMTVVDTLVPGETIAENRPVRYVTLTLNLPVEATP